MSYADDRIRHDADRTTDRTLRLTVPEAAGAMGISAEAVRQRIKRGTLTTEKDAGGTVYVLLDADSTRTNGDRTYDITTDSTGLVEELRDRVRSLETQLFEERTANRENRRLLAAALERIPAIEEAPSEPRDATETGSGLHPGVVTPKATMRGRRRAFRAAPVGGADYSPDSGIRLGGEKCRRDFRTPSWSPRPCWTG